MADRLDVFTAAAFDHHAEQLGLPARWARIRKDRRQVWREWIARAARSAAASQRSPLAGEPLPNAPDPVRMFAMALSTLADGRRSRAATTRGRRRWRSEHGAELDGLWVGAIEAGRRALAELDAGAAEGAALADPASSIEGIAL